MVALVVVAAMVMLAVEAVVALATYRGAERVVEVGRTCVVPVRHRRGGGELCGAAQGGGGAWRGAVCGCGGGWLWWRRVVCACCGCGHGGARFRHGLWVV